MAVVEVTLCYKWKVSALEKWVGYLLFKMSSFIQRWVHINILVKNTCLKLEEGWIRQ